MIQIGHATCGDWSKGFMFEQTLADAKSALPQLADASIAKIMGVATRLTARNTRTNLIDPPRTREPFPRKDSGSNTLRDSVITIDRVPAG